MQVSESKQNSLLSLITFITSIGDFISFFAVLKIVADSSGNILMASAVIPAKSLALVLAGLMIPSLNGKFTTRQIFIGTQTLSFFIISLLLYSVHIGLSFPWLFVGIIFLQSFLKQVFDSAREYASKRLGNNLTHRTFQAQLLQGLYGAQFIGPILSYLLINSFGVEIPIFLDACSFAVATIVSLWLPNENMPSTVLSIRQPIKYILANASLRNIFLLRTLGYWIPVGIFNYLIFSVVESHYNLKIVNSAWVYTAIGLGSLLASTALKKESWSRFNFGNIDDQHLAFGALLLLGVTRIGFLNLPSFSSAMIILMIGGICNGLNATATQSLRRKFTTNRQFPEIVGLELIVGRIIDLGTAAGCGLLIAHQAITYTQAIWFSIVFLTVIAVLHLSPTLSSTKAIKSE